MNTSYPILPLGEGARRADEGAGSNALQRIPSPVRIT